MNNALAMTRMEFVCTTRELVQTIVQLDGEERLGQPYWFELCVDFSDEVDVTALLYQRAKIVLQCSKLQRQYHGVVSAVTDWQDERGHHLTKLRLEPHLATLGLSVRSQVYCSDQQTLPHVLAQVLQEYGVDFSLRLRAQYPLQAFVYQYQESTLAFVQRTMEALGLFYFFQQHADGEQLVLCDANTYIDDNRVALAFRPAGCLTTALDTHAVTQLTRHARYEPTVQTNIVQFEGIVHAPLLMAGTNAVLTQHPRAVFNTDYYVTAVRHHAPPGVLRADNTHAIDYQQSWEACTELTPYLIPRRTPCPQIHSTLSAIIEGDTEQVYLDEQGRYKVQLMHNWQTPEAMRGSVWLRMATPLVGDDAGMHFPVRPGTEVLLSFDQGDPQHAVVIAAVPNSQSLAVQRANDPACNIVDSIGGQRITLDDHVSSQRMRIEGGQAHSVLQLGRREIPTLPAANGVLPTLSQRVSLANSGLAVNESLAVQSDGSLSANPSALPTHGLNVETQGGFSSVVEGDHDELIGGSSNRFIQGHVTQHSGAAHIQLQGGQVQTVGGRRDTTVSGNQDETVNGVKSTTVYGNTSKINYQSLTTVVLGAYPSLNFGLNGVLTLGGNVEIGIMLHCIFETMALEMIAIHIERSAKKNSCFLIESEEALATFKMGWRKLSNVITMSAG